MEQVCSRIMFYKAKGPKGWSGKHIISVKLSGWMNQSFIIKHLQESFELLWKLVHIRDCSHHTASFFGHEMKMLLSSFAKERSVIMKH